MEQELKDQGRFKDFYQFTFNFAKNPGQKGLGKIFCWESLYSLKSSLTSFVFSSLDLEMAIAYWKLVLAGRFKFLDLWNTFLVVSFFSLWTLSVYGYKYSSKWSGRFSVTCVAGTPQKIHS